MLFGTVAPMELGCGNNVKYINVKYKNVMFQSVNDWKIWNNVMSTSVSHLHQQLLRQYHSFEVYPYLNKYTTNTII